MRPLKVWQMCSYEQSGNSTDYPRRLSLIWIQSSLENSGNLFANQSISNEECQQRTTPKLNDKQKEPTKYWKVTYETLSIMIRTTGINCCHWPNTNTTTQLPMHIECHPFTQTAVFIRKLNGGKNEKCRTQASARISLCAWCTGCV